MNQNETALSKRLEEEFNIYMPAYLLSNLALKHKMNENGVPIAQTLLKADAHVLNNLIAELDSEYEKHPAVLKYIHDYLEETCDQKDSFSVNREYDILARSLPEFVKSMPMCANYKLCYYIADQCSKQNGSSEDVGSALLTDSAQFEKLYSQLCRNLDSGIPMDVAMHEAGRTVDKSLNATVKNTGYDTSKDEMDNFREKCGDEAVEKYKKTVFDRVASVVNAPSNLKQSFEDARRREMGDERYEKMQEAKKEKKAQQHERKQMNSRLGSLDYSTGYRTRSPYGRGSFQRGSISMYLKWLHLAGTILLIALCLFGIIRNKLSFKSFVYILAIAAGALGLKINFKDRKMLLAIIVLVTGIAFAISGLTI